MDDDAIYKHPKVGELLTARRCWTYDFTPTSASWRNGGEGFIAKLTKRRIAHDMFRSVGVIIRRGPQSVYSA